MAPKRGRHLDDVEAGRDRPSDGELTTHSLTLRRDHLDALRARLLRPDGAEHVAYVFCSTADILADPWDRQDVGRRRWRDSLSRAPRRSAPRRTASEPPTSSRT